MMPVLPLGSEVVESLRAGSNVHAAQISMSSFPGFTPPFSPSMVADNDPLAGAYQAGPPPIGGSYVTAPYALALPALMVSDIRRFVAPKLAAGYPTRVAALSYPAISFFMAENYPSSPSAISLVDPAQETYQAGTPVGGPSGTTIPNAPAFFVDTYVPNLSDSRLGSAIIGRDVLV